ncbi:hypothetical protein V5O48_009454 [Marasmius crinis-equi]|uniref:Uncharacterized protein n=1 Tax=Marasmius crinis-equi TaxID=585013 RepID=A0ABR3FB22_9AGAR
MEILEVWHHMDVSDMIKEEIGAMEAYEAHKKPGAKEQPPEDTEEVDDGLGGGHFTVGSKLRPTTFLDFAARYKIPESRFRVDLSNFLSTALPAGGVQLSEWIRYQPSDRITPFQFLKINYESLETWRVATDYLRCNPHFFNFRRYDFVLFKTEASPVFAQLQHLLICEVDGKKYVVAFVESYKVMARRQRSDRDFGIIRLQKTGTEFILAHTIIRGALVADSESAADEKLVVNAVDYNMFLRAKRDWPGYTDIKD